MNDIRVDDPKYSMIAKQIKEQNEILRDMVDYLKLLTSQTRFKEKPTMTNLNSIIIVDGIQYKVTSMIKDEIKAMLAPFSSTAKKIDEPTTETEPVDVVAETESKFAAMSDKDFKNWKKEYQPN